MKLWLILGAFALGGCSSTARLLTEEGRGASAVSEADAETAAAGVAIYSGKEIGRRYRTLGPVIAAADGTSGERALRHLKKEAALLGADAVTELRLEIGAGYWAPSVKASGLAVKLGPAHAGKGKSR